MVGGDCRAVPVWSMESRKRGHAGTPTAKKGHTPQCGSNDDGWEFTRFSFPAGSSAPLFSPVSVFCPLVSCSLLPAFLLDKRHTQHKHRNNSGTAEYSRHTAAKAVVPLKHRAASNYYWHHVALSPKTTSHFDISRPSRHPSRGQTGKSFLPCGASGPAVAATD